MDFLFWIRYKKRLRELTKDSDVFIWTASQCMPTVLMLIGSDHYVLATINFITIDLDIKECLTVPVVIVEHDVRSYNFNGRRL